MNTHTITIDDEGRLLLLALLGDELIRCHTYRLRGGDPHNTTDVAVDIITQLTPAPGTLVS